MFLTDCPEIKHLTFIKVRHPSTRITTKRMFEIATIKANIDSTMSKVCSVLRGITVPSPISTSVPEPSQNKYMKYCPMGNCGGGALKLIVNNI